MVSNGETIQDPRCLQYCPVSRLHNGLPLPLLVDFDLTSFSLLVGNRFYIQSPSVDITASLRATLEVIDDNLMLSS